MLYLSWDKFSSKYCLNGADKMVVEMCLIFFLKTFKIWHGQNDDFCGMFLCPVIDHPKNSLNKSQGMLQVIIIGEIYFILVDC